MTTDYTNSDYFRDEDLVADPFPYFDFLRDQCPVHRESQHGVVMVTGYEEVVEVFNDPDRFSSCTASTGPFAGLSAPLGADDVREFIAAHRDELPFSDQILTFDPPKHTSHRSLLMRLITPKRLHENEAFMWDLADRQLDTFIHTGECEFISEFASPFAMLVIADLLGVPVEDRARFRERLLRRGDGGAGVGAMADGEIEHTPLAWLYDQFSAYIADRRREPRNDVLTGLATATFPDGSVPEVIDAVRIASNLFAAGQETTVRLLSTALRLIGEQPELQQALRNDAAVIPNFIEECLRLESPVKGDFRVSTVRTEVGGVEIPAGTDVMVLNGAANRDPRKFANPSEFKLDRTNARQHLAFGRGAHTCPGAPLARAEARVSIERILARTTDIRISERAHGPAGVRRYRYVPTFILRGLADLTLEFDPAAGQDQ